MDLTSRKARLDATIKDLERIREEWESLGSPVMARGANLQPIAHPLLKIINEKELMVERLSRPLEAGRAGRPLGAVSAPDRVAAAEPPRRGKLKAV